ncbi:unnamed protein product [Urochloa decumbens]|uniref:ARM repeat superfamily protein n=1 Tax=Urochloa decumbens TaxID=240449 RepID=A0ABC9BVP1_9POAL
MATTAASGGEISIAVEITEHAEAAGDVVPPRESSDEVPQSERREQQQRVISSADMVRRKLKRLNMIVLCIALLEWAGNAIGTLAFLWATVVLLGGFSSFLTRTDFWFATVMIFMEGSRVFIRNDASINQWLFGSTSAFRWENFSFPHMSVPPKFGNLIAVVIGVGFSFAPLEFHPQIAAGILKVALLFIISQLLARLRQSWFATITLLLLFAAACCIAFIYVVFKIVPENTSGHWSKAELNYLKLMGLFFASINGSAILALLIAIRMPRMRKPVPLLCFKVIIAFGLACLPFLQVKLASHYRYFSIAVAIVLLILGNDQGYWAKDYSSPETSERNNSSPRASEQNNNSSETSEWLWGEETLEEQINNSSCGLLLQILETILPILFLWSVMFPLPGISLKISFYMLFSVITAVLIANLQIPVAFLQVLLSILRIRSLLGHHHHHDYHPLPPDASPNLVPSIVVFFMLELCQGLSYIVAVILGLTSLLHRRSFVCDLKFKEEWGAKAVNLYHRQAYQARTERGLFPLERHTPSFTSFAIESLGSTSSEVQVIGLRVLHNFLERWDCESKTELIAEIIYTHKKAVPSLIDMLGSTVARHQHMRLLAATITNELSSSLKISDYPGMLKMVSSLLDADKTQDSMPNHVSENDGGDDTERQLFEKTIFMRRILFYTLGLSILEKLSCDHDNCTEIAKDATNIITKIIGLISYLTEEENSGESETQQKIIVCDSALKFVRRLTIKGRKIGVKFRQVLSENPFLLNTLDCIIDLEDCQPELWETVIDIIAKLALDEAARQDIGCTQSIIHKLIHAFLRPDDVNSSSNNDSSLQMTAGEALVNLTIMSTDNCWAILTVEPGHNLIENLTSMLENECYRCVAANLLHNLCANSRDKLVDLGANVHLESALTKVMQIIRADEGKQLEAALCVASQIGHVIPEYFAQMLESETDATAAELVKKLVDTLKSNREPCLEYPRLRRVLVEVVIAIVELCPRYKVIFREKGVKEALDMVKGTPSRLEKYRVFLDGEGLVAESITMRDLVDNAKKLIHRAAPTPGVQPGDHA